MIETSKRLLATGIPQRDVKKYLGAIPRYDVYPENWEAVTWLLMLRDRWLVSPSGRLLRMDDQAILAQMEMRGVRRRDRPGLLQRLMDMEAAALSVFNEGST